MSKTTKSTVTKNQKTTAQKKTSNSTGETMNSTDFDSINSQLQDKYSTIFGRFVSGKMNQYMVSEVDFKTGISKGTRLRCSTIEKKDGKRVKTFEHTNQVAQVPTKTSRFQAAIWLDGPNEGKAFLFYYGNDDTKKLKTELGEESFVYRGARTDAELQKVCDEKYSKYLAECEEDGVEPSNLSPVGKYMLALPPGSACAGFFAALFNTTNIEKEQSTGNGGKVAKLQAELAQAKKDAEDARKEMETARQEMAETRAMMAEFKAWKESKATA